MSAATAAHADNNLRASGLVVLAMAIFTFEDYLIKVLATRIPTGELLLFAGITGAGFIAAWGLYQRLPLVSRDLLLAPVMVRNLAEFLGTIVGMAALVANPLSLHSAIFQATPLVVMLLAGFYLREKIGPVRVAGAVAGLIGVLLIIEPGNAAFRPAIILSLLCVLAVAIRDIATRTIPRRVASLQLVFASYLTGIPAGLLLLAFEGDALLLPAWQDTAVFTAATLIGLLGGFALTAGVRGGEASFVVPFRYWRILFALLAGAVLLSEPISTGMLAGSALLVAAGIAVFWTEARNSRREAAFLAGDGPL